MSAGGTVCIIVADAVPAAAPFNAQNVITVTSTFNGTATLSRTDTTTVGAAGSSGLTLVKSVRNVTQGTPAGTSNTAKPGDILEYAITYTNPAGRLALGHRHHRCDAGVHDVPVGLVRRAAARGRDLVQRSPTQPCSPLNGSGSVVWTLGGTLAAAGSGTVLYQVKVAP